MARRNSIRWGAKVAFLLAHTGAAFCPGRLAFLRQPNLNHLPALRSPRLSLPHAEANDAVSSPSPLDAAALSTMKVADLKSLAAVRGIKVGAMRKALLVELLARQPSQEGDDGASSSPPPPRTMPLRMAVPEEAPTDESSTAQTEALTWKERWASEGAKNPDSPSGRLSQLPRLDPEGLVVNRTALLPGSNEASMELQFIGTASCMPSSTRGVSCLALRRDGDVMIFDAGEGSQTLLQQSSVTVTKISRIFVTHAHGDHTFGLIGLLCMVGQECDRSGAPIDVYGPDGLRDFLRASAQLSVSRIVAPYRVHELKDVPWIMPLPPHMAPPQVPQMSGLPLDKRFGEVSGGRDIWPDADGAWTLVDEALGIGLLGADHQPPRSLKDQDNNKHSGSVSVSGPRDKNSNGKKADKSSSRGQRSQAFDVGTKATLSVRAAPMVHTVPCVGFVVSESARPGALNAGLVDPLIQSNHDALKEKGFKVPAKLKQVFKMMKPADEFKFPDGTVITGKEAVTPPRQGRKVVVCGDTADASHIAPLATDCDVLVHEATNAFLSGVDKGTSASEVARSSRSHGHSTPEMAGKFAKQIGAKRLVLHHFSPRYKGDAHEMSVFTMLRIEELARKASGLLPNQVHAAWDLSNFAIPMRSETVSEGD